MTKVTDEALGKIARQQYELFRRVREGTLNPGIVSKQLQDTIQGNFMLSQIPIWVSMKQRPTKGAYYIERDIQKKTNYSLPKDLTIPVGTDSYNISLARLRSSDLGAKNKSALEVCRSAQSLGLQLCQPDLILHLCLQYEMKEEESFIMPLYGFSSKTNAPGQSAVFQCGGEGEKHKIFGVDPQKCGVLANPEWVFQLKRTPQH